MYFFVHLVDSIALYLQIYKNFFFFLLYEFNVD